MTGFPADRRVLVIGDYYIDLVFAGLPQWPQPGKEVFAANAITLPGGAFTPQLALHRLGVPVVWAAHLGNDDYSELVLAAARREGLDESAYRIDNAPVRNVSVAACYAEERGFISYKEPVDRTDHAELIHRHRPTLVLLIELYTGARLRAIAAAARAVGAEIFMDCQHTGATLADPELTEALASVDIIAPNAAEALQLTTVDTVSDAIARLAELTPTVLVKDGGRGAVAARGPKRFSATAPTMDVVDTIGAGDCFDAGFVAGHLYGLDLPASLRLGTLCGSLSVTGTGGAAAPGLDRLAALAPELVPWASSTRPAQ